MPTIREALSSAALALRGGAAPVPTGIPRLQAVPPVKDGIVARGVTPAIRLSPGLHPPSRRGQTVPTGVTPGIVTDRGTAMPGTVSPSMGQPMPPVHSQGRHA
jgi:hypothetical protein